MRPVIDTKTLRIFKSLQECATYYHCTRTNISQMLRYNGYILYDNSRRYKYSLEYLDVWIRDYTSQEKVELCEYKNVDFL